MLPQNPDEILPLVRAIVIVGIVVLLIDLWLLARWLAYQRLRNTALREYGVVLDEPLPDNDSPESVVQDSYPSAEGVYPGTDEPSDADALPEHDPRVVRRPFAKTWSLAHPFLGFQFAFLVANMFASVPALAILPFVPDGIRGLGNPNGAGMKFFLAATVISMLYLQNGLFVGVTSFFLRQYGTSLQGIGMGVLTRRYALLGIGLGVLMFAAAAGGEALIVELLKRMLTPPTFESLKKMSDSVNAATIFLQMPGPAWQIVFVIAGAVAAPIGEEVFFRGFLYNALRVRWSVKAGILLSGLAFALIHANPFAILLIFPMGMLLAYIYERTGSLWVTILIHAVNNGLSFLMLALYPQMGQ